MSCIPPTRDSSSFEFLGRKIGNDPYLRAGFPGARHRAFVIAELSVNHNGRENMAADMIRRASDCGADAVKLQLRDLPSCYGELAKNRGASPGGLANYLPVIEKTALELESYGRLKEVAEDHGIGFLVTPFDIPSVERLEGIGVEAYKIASCDAVNTYLIDAVIETGKPFVVSTGMCSESEIFRLNEYLERMQAKGRYALMHTISSYPAAYGDCQLHLIPRFKHHFGVPVGWSGHERGVSVSVSAVALGADIIERHFTLDRTLPGPDQAASIEPEGFAKMIERIRAFENAYGDPAATRIKPRPEIACEEIMRKSLVAAKNISAGGRIEKKDLYAVGPGRGLSPAILMAPGRRWVASRALGNGERLKAGDLSPVAQEAAK